MICCNVPASLTLLTTIMLAPLAAVKADDTARHMELFSKTPPGSTVTIPPKDYHLDGTTPLKLPSGMTVSAYGARFHLPQTLGDKARVVLFPGENVSDFRWFGGGFSDMSLILRGQKTPGNRTQTRARF
ncbi:MAG: hypothetical protein EBR86_13910 [Planctomycetia bacterium]|nr:hypothetical protein [Planctomycetia bacterium]